MNTDGKRTLPEWVGATPDSAIPPRVRLRVFEAHGGVCALSGRKIGPGDAWQVDHRIALANGGRHAESNLQPVLVGPHREKTRADVGLKAKADRIAKKHRGIWPASKRPLRSRGFEPTRQK